MKLKVILLVLLSLIVLTGCSAKSAQQHGSGISVEIDGTPNVKHMTLIKYVDGKEAFNENVINADNSAFANGDIIWFDVPSSATNSTVEIVVTFSENLDATNPHTTEKLNVSNSTEWIDAKLTQDHQIKLVDMK